MLRETLSSKSDPDCLNNNLGILNPDNPLGREMMARQVARQFCRLREVHSWSMDADQAAKMAAN